LTVAPPPPCHHQSSRAGVDRHGERAVTVLFRLTVIDGDGDGRGPMALCIGVKSIAVGRGLM